MILEVEGEYVDEEEEKKLDEESKKVFDIASDMLKSGEKD